MLDKPNVMFLLWGPSGCGKDYFTTNLLKRDSEKDDEYPRLCTIKNYTDRPMREGESQGHPYVFCKSDDPDYPDIKNVLLEKTMNGTLLSFDQFYTASGTYRYLSAFTQDCCTSDSIMSASYFQVLDIFKWIFENGRRYPNIIIWPIFISTNDLTRINTLYKREMKKSESDQNFKEIVRRYIESDNVDYSSEAKETVNSLMKKHLNNRGLYSLFEKYSKSSSFGNYYTAASLDTLEYTLDEIRDYIYEASNYNDKN